MSSSSSQLIMAFCLSQPMDDLTRYMPLHKYILEGDLESITFLSFGTMDTISMFSSLAAIIMFLSILTSRYTEADFLYALPTKLIQCLALSLFSVTAMMVAFATAVYLVFFGNNLRAIALVVASLCLPIYLFASSQYTLLAYNFETHNQILSTFRQEFMIQNWRLKSSLGEGNVELKRMLSYGQRQTMEAALDE
ncbi:hypothetical protein Pint_12039 [Pistacia integerrima]|uniref:Uncharacterized protein n=1 Tax=Pistacia integerrima TaxID=434235 RepID=A0ACC0XFS7_9ROSI|nr:hypothetical protein Pint_12039 [Pistacia integerrima]